MRQANPPSENYASVKPKEPPVKTVSYGPVQIGTALWKLDDDHVTHSEPIMQEGETYYITLNDVRVAGKLRWLASRLVWHTDTKHGGFMEMKDMQGNLLFGYPTSLYGYDSMDEFKHDQPRKRK